MWNDILDIVICVVFLLLSTSALICAITKTPLISYRVTNYNHPKGGTETEGDEE